jgi:hypothetical protein
MGACTATDYGVYECDNDDDCAVGKHCCAELEMQSVVAQVRCFAEACSDATNTRQICHGDGECPTMYPTCTDFSYPPYKACE